MRRVMILCALSWAAAGCTVSHGPEQADLPLAAAPKGRTIEVQLRGVAGAPRTTIAGELLEVRDSSLVVLADSVIVAHFNAIRRVSVDGHLPTLSGREYTDYRRRRPGSYLRRVSRYPYGAPPEAMEQILRERGQTAPQKAAPDTVRSTGDAAGATAHAVAATSTDDGSAAAAVRFLNDARAGTDRYRERRHAIADGYRRLGPAFPGMGEHWVHPGLIVNGRFDARTPSVLCYADSAGVPALVGVAYAVAVLPGAAPPAVPGGVEVWHEHSDAVDDETLLLVHPAAHDGDASQPRLAMFHAWIWLDNPDGPFAQNNWTLPFAQLGLVAPPNSTAAAAHGAALLTVGEPYYMRLLDVLASPAPAERRAFAVAVSSAAARAQAWHTALESQQINAQDVAVLERIWTDLWHALDAAAGPATRARLAEYAGRPQHLNH